MGSSYMDLMIKMGNCGKLVMLMCVMVFGLMGNIHMLQLHSTPTLKVVSDQEVTALTLSNAAQILEIVEY